MNEKLRQICGSFSGAVNLSVFARTATWLLVMCLCCQISTACSDDEPVKKSPFLQAPTRAMLKENVEVRLLNVSPSVEVSVDFGDGTVLKGSGPDPILHAYTSPGDYEMRVKAGDVDVKKRIRVYKLLALSEALKDFRSPENKKVWVMAHRGHTLDRSVPENSVPSVADAISAGADCIETDTHITKDGVVVVCHNQTINATTNGSGDITQMTYDEILQYNLLDRNGKVTAYKLPTLEEFLKAARGKIYVNLDYSPRTASTEQVMRVVKDLDMMEQVFFYCNNSVKAEEVLSLDPKAHAYTWTGQHGPMMGREGNYFVQYNYKPDGKHTPVGTSLTDGMLCSVNFLFIGDNSEYVLPEEWIDDAIRIYGRICMIQTDVAPLLVKSLEKRGMR